MSTPAGQAGGNLYYTLVLEANDFMATLKTAEGQALSFDETMAVMKEEIKKLMEEFGIDAPTAIKVLQQVRGELDLDAEALARLQELARQGALKQVGDDIRQSDFAGISFASTLRMIEGVIVSMAVFQGFQMIVQTIQDAVAAADQYYQSLQNIAVAQSALAQQGVSVTNQQILDIVDQLHQKWVTISQVDIASAVGQAGLMASEYHLSVDQMTQLANEAAILHQLDPSKPMEAYVTQLAKALEGGRSLAANGDQIAITAGELLTKAKELGLVGDAYKGTLTDQQKIVAGIAIEYDRLHPEEQKAVADTNSYLGQSQQLAATWKDTLTAAGELFAPLLNGVQQFLNLILKINLTDSTEQMKGWLDIWAHLVAYGAMYIQILFDIHSALQGNFTDLENISKQWDTILAKAEANAQAMMQGNVNLTNTPTSGLAPGDVTGASTIDQSKLTSILDSVSKDYQNYFDSVSKAQEAFNTKMQDLQDRYNLQVQNEIQNANLRMANEKQDFRLKELQQEQDFQQKMRELTDRYLLDLEDGLRKRDAEAVIKTIEKYNNEKTIDQQQEALKLQQDKQAETVKLEQMKAEEQLRLSQMKQEYQLQQTEANRAYQQQLTDLQSALDNKLQEEAVKAQQDLGLNQNSIDSIYKLFTEYYGSNGKFAQEQQGAYTKMIEQSQGFVDQMANIMAEFAGVLSSVGGMSGPIVGSTNTGSYRGGGGTTATTPSSTIPKRQAAGGVALAASATDVTFGEAGPELAMFLPLNAAGGAGMSLAGVGGGGGAMGGQALILLQLDAGLEASIVNTTLTHAAIQIERVYRSH